MFKGDGIQLSSGYLLAFRLGQILVYKKICRALGIRQNVVSGGGSLATHLDDFYEVIGLDVLNGWGLSEVSCYQPLPSLCHSACRTLPRVQGPTIDKGVTSESKLGK